MFTVPYINVIINQSICYTFASFSYLFVFHFGPKQFETENRTKLMKAESCPWGWGPDSSVSYSWLSLPVLVNSGNYIRHEKNHYRTGEKIPDLDHIV